MTTKKTTATKDTNNSITYKIILLGSSGVGKTSFFNKIALDKFNEKAFLATIGMDRMTVVCDIVDPKTKEDVQLKIELWDTAGQERFQGLTRSYLKNADGVILMFDITNRESMEKLTSWLNELKNSNNTALVRILANKADLAGKFPNCIKKEEIENLAKKLNYPFLGLYSCKTSTQEELKELISKIGYDLYRTIDKKHRQIKIKAVNKSNNRCLCGK